MLRDAFRAVHENVQALLLFLLVDLPITLGVSALNDLYLEPNKEELGERYVGLVQMTAMVVEVCVYAALVSIVFSRMARNIDRPIWKIQGDKDALARFFPMWLLTSFLCVGVIQFSGIVYAQGQQDVGQVLFFVGVVLLIMVIPFGSIVTFIGNGRGEDVRVAFSIIPRVLDRFLLAMLLGFFQLWIVLGLQESEGTAFWMRPLISGADVYLDCVVFSYVFLACREQRDLEEPIDPYDL